MPNIVEIAVNNDAFKTLVTAVTVAELVEALQQPGPLTVFAPNDDAFAKLLPGTVNSLVQNIPQLQRILKYHVVAGRYTTAELKHMETLTSLEGSPIPIRCGEQFEVKNATVLAADIEASNGIIHVLDTVILMG